MKRLVYTSISIALISLMPIAASAQVFNSNATAQSPFLSQLQALQHELLMLTATIQSLITAAGGTVSTQPTQLLLSPTSTPVPTVPTLLPSPLGGISSGSLSGDQLTSSLLQEFDAAGATSTQTISLSTATPTTTVKTLPQSIATQFDPSCISGLWANGAICGGLYYCSANGGYWTAVGCAN